MASHDQKTIVLQLLTQQIEPLNFHDLQEKLQGDVKERTLRRWLNKWIKVALLA